MAETLTIRTASSTEVIQIAVPGPQGPAGQGVPVGGTTGQVLLKASGTDYDTEWAAAGSGSGSVTSVAMAGTGLTITGSPITSTGTITANVAYGSTANTACEGNDARLSDARTPSSTLAHASSHASGGSDPIAPSTIGAQSRFDTSTASASVAEVPLQLSASRARNWSLQNFHSIRDVYLPVTDIQVGDIAVLIGANINYTLTVKVPAAGGLAIVDPENTPSASPVVISANGQQYRFIVTSTSAFNPWRFVDVDTHTHPASAISDSTTAGRALLTGADAAAQRTSLGLGTAATSATGDFAAASHAHGNINSSGQVGSTSGLPLVTTTAGAVTTLALGAAGTILTVNSGASGVEFAAPAVDMTGASASTAGTAGLAPQPAIGKQGDFLRGDATFTQTSGQHMMSSIDQGQVLFCNPFIVPTSTNTGFTADRAYYVPIVVCKRLEIDGYLIFSMRSASSQSVYLALYNDSNGLPSSLIANSSASVADPTHTTGVKVALGSSLFLEQSKVWIAISFQGNAQHQACNNIAPFGLSGMGGNINQTSGVIRSSSTVTHGTWANPAPTLENATAQRFVPYVGLFMV